MNYFFPKEAKPTRQPKGEKRRSLFRRVGPFPSPKTAVGLDGIRDGAGLIKDLMKIVRRGPSADPRLRLDSERRIDVISTAAAFGRSPSEFQAHMMLRQEETRRTAVGSFALAWGLLLLWGFETLFLQWRGSRLLAALEFLPFCGVMFLYSFRSAWLNWQLRTGRLGSA
ncbi:MAG: hypothetical protein ACRYHQ_19740, partial [Janthinobacterium lividum]